MTRSVTTFLMFEGKCEEAVRAYVALVPGSAIDQVEHWKAGEPGKEGSVKRMFFHLGNTQYVALDSPVHHAFTFTPSISLFVECDDEAELDRLYSALSEGGQALMPLGSYGFSRKFGWLNDRFGVSWQLNWS
jgi:predicted 3-demethylubiquinone-9 3-methyltransferase (glyoxalase superfamily)